MKSNFVNHAVTIGKILAMLSSVGYYRKEAVKNISRIRSTVETALALAVVRKGADEKNAALVLKRLHDALLVQVNTKFDAHRLAETVALNKPGRFPFQLSLADLAATKPMTVHPVYSSQEQKLALDVVHRYASLVRNASWLPVLTAFAIRADSLLPLSVALSGKFGSTMGQANVEANMLVLGVVLPPAAVAKPSRAKKVTVVAAGDITPYFEVTVRMGQDKLLVHPAVKAALTKHPGLGKSSELVALLASAATPTAVTASDVNEVVKAKLAQFLVALDALCQGQVRIEAAARRKSKEQQETKALDALRGMGPLLAVLKANPDLLAKA